MRLKLQTKINLCISSTWMFSNRKTAQVKYLSWNVARVVVLARNPRDRRSSGFPGRDNHECNISTQIFHEYRFLFITCENPPECEGFCRTLHAIRCKILEKILLCWRDDVPLRKLWCDDVTPTSFWADLVKRAMTSIEARRQEARVERRLRDVTTSWRALQRIKSCIALVQSGKILHAEWSS